jgi:hypothetical protein
MMIASDNRVDLVTIDGAGGGTGNSPVKMMNEWGIPTIELIQIMKRIYQNLEAKGKHLPQLAIGGGIVMEDQAFKALALGAPYIKFVAIGRASMAAAMTGKKAGDDIQSGHVPQTLKDYGDTIEGCFADYSRVQKSYARPGQVITTGTIGVYSYMDRLTYGLKQLFALNRKFTLGLIDASDIVSLTDVSQKITGVLSYKDLLDVALSEGGAD